jgi:hypothetical protein
MAFDDLRRSASDDLDEAFAESDSRGKSGGRGGFMGMTAFQRMILSILFFMLVTVMGVLVLMVTGRLGI